MKALLPHPPGAAHVTGPPGYVMVRTPVEPAEVQESYAAHRELDSVLYDSQAVDVAEQASLMHDPTLLPGPAPSQYADCAGQSLVTVALGLSQAEDKQDCWEAAEGATTATTTVEAFIFFDRDPYLLSLSLFLAIPQDQVVIILASGRNSQRILCRSLTDKIWDV
ncbi:hypothetical protein AAE478_008780 [Parahypoxylon ruwenzoriense]